MIQAVNDEPALLVYTINILQILPSIQLLTHFVLSLHSTYCIDQVVSQNANCFHLNCSDSLFSEF